MSTTAPLHTEPVIAAPESAPRPAPPRPRRRARNRLAWWLIAPAAVFMLLVHVLPMLGGVFLSLKDLNTFTFFRLFDAPWAGLDNYRAILDPSTR